MPKPIALLALIVLLSACSDLTGSSTPSMSGTWMGTTGNTNPVTLSFTVIEKQGEFHGWGSMRVQGPPTDYYSIGISGVHVHPDVGFAGQFDRFEDFTFNGKFEDRDTIVGRLRGSGLQNFEIRLTRQE